MGAQISRRRLIGGALGAATALALPELIRPWASARVAVAPQVELPQPRVLRSRGGHLHVNLVCRRASVQMGAPVPVRTYTYDGVVPGYTWELAAGDTLTVDVINRLPRLTPAEHHLGMEMTRPHDWTTTNLHTHGLHVAPDGIADNIFRTIPPGTHKHFEIPIPGDHQAGLFWYHPHHHGGVTQQVRAGMAGAIVVRGDLDQVDEVRAA